MKLLYSFLLLSLIALACVNERHLEIDFSDKHSVRDFLETDGIYSVLIAGKEEIYLEEYFNAGHADSVTNIQSLTKGIMSILVGIAIEHGAIHSESDALAAYFPTRFQSLEPEKHEITVRHILDQTSGLSWRGFPEHNRWLQSQDPINYVLQKKLRNNPGEKYNYNSGATHILSGVISESTGISTYLFAKQNFFGPLNIYSVRWMRQNDGYHDGGGFGLELRSRDLLKIGQMLLQNGCYQGKEVVGKDWIEKLFDRKTKLTTNWGLPESTHGMCWYKAFVQDLEIDYGMGFGGQFIFIVPSRDLVVVVTHNINAIYGVRQQRRFLKHKLFRLIEGFSRDV